MKKYTYTHSADFEVFQEELFDWHMRPGALQRLLPPWRDVRLLFPPGQPQEVGSRVGLKIKWGPFWKKWILAYRDFIPDHEFSDVQIQGPFRFYEHCHVVRARDAATSNLTDQITYTPPWFVPQRCIQTEFEHLFAWRCALMRADFELFSRYARAPMRILLSGASGFIGSHMKSFLETAGHEVIRLVRRKEDSQDTIYWDPIHGDVSKEQFEGFDVVIHLAGENIAAGRWSKARKERLFHSRCRDTWLLSQALCRLYQPPKLLITASAIGFYGHRGDEELTEESSKGQGFLADLCSKWEAATEAIENRGTRVVHARFGAVLSARGGMLRRLLPAFRLGLGGNLGSGEQYLSWIGIDDLLGALYHALRTDEIQGPLNVVAPEPLRQKEFAKILAKHLHRPRLLNLPTFALKLALGEMAEELMLASARAVPEKLLKTGYQFRYPDLATALQFVL